jgi:hypothetical protein
LVKPGDLESVHNFAALAPARKLSLALCASDSAGHVRLATNHLFTIQPNVHHDDEMPVEPLLKTPANLGLRPVVLSVRLSGV